MKLRSLLPLLLVLPLFAVGGCLFSPDDDTSGGGGGGGETELPFPDTPDKLIANFQTVYEDRDLLKYTEAILHQQYKFILQDQTVEDFGLPDEIYEYEDEVQIATKLFSESPGRDGNVISQIDVDIMQPQGVWQPVDDSDQYFGGIENAQKRTYNVRLVFFVQGENLQLIVEGTVIFYVAGTPTEHQGQTKLYHQLLGQWDFTNG